MRGGGAHADQSLMARHVSELQLSVYATPGYLQRAGTPTHPLALENTHHRIVGYCWARTSKAFPYAMSRDGESVHVLGGYVLTVDDGNAYLAGVAGWACSSCRTTWPRRTQRVES
ncbi:hypothetical protein DFR29_12810 [Tahibacter aquaticus]|uniref:LysR substrate binding domain-containing protein n=1 Tax=Tahibacter aquaticus TaxID=520092 RepID=A0A4R6YIA6_9GAMM|nr:hypothetical protein DFR29_12810 [Tahibacter aquaticus]